MLHQPGLIHTRIFDLCKAENNVLLVVQVFVTGTTVRSERLDVNVSSDSLTGLMWKHTVVLTLGGDAFRDSG